MRQMFPRHTSHMSMNVSIITLYVSMQYPYVHTCMFVCVCTRVYVNISRIRAYTHYYPPPKNRRALTSKNIKHKQTHADTQTKTQTKTKIPRHVHTDTHTHFLTHTLSRTLTHTLSLFLSLSHTRTCEVRSVSSHCASALLRGAKAARN